MRFRHYLTPRLLIAIVGICFGAGFQQGFQLAMLHTFTPIIKKWLRTTRFKKTLCDTYLSWIIYGLFLVGGLCGTLAAYFAVKCIGPKKTLMAVHLVVMVGTVFQLLVIFDMEELFLAANFLMGFSVATFMSICPIYLSEIAPEQIRGAVAMTYEVFNILGGMLVVLMGLFMGEDHLWPYMYYLPIGPTLVQFCALIFTPESPKYLLITKGEEEKAYNALLMLRGEEYQKSVDKYFSVLQDEDELLDEYPMTFKAVVMDIALRTPWIICVVAIIGQKACGIYIALIYAAQTYKKYGLAHGKSVGGTICVAVIFLVATIMVLFLIEYVGRRVMMQISYIGMCLTTILLAITLSIKVNQMFFHYIGIGLFVSFAFFYSLGAGGIPWVIMGEMIPHPAKSRVAAMTVPFSFLSGFVTVQVYLMSYAYLGPLAFVVVVTIDFLSFFFFYVYLPETMQKSSLEIVTMFR